MSRTYRRLKDQDYFNKIHQLELIKYSNHEKVFKKQSKCYRDCYYIIKGDFLHRPPKFNEYRAYYKHLLLRTDLSPHFHKISFIDYFY